MTDGHPQFVAATADGIELASAGSQGWVVQKTAPRCALALAAGPQGVFAGTESGLLRSSDGGRSWASAGLAGCRVTAVACAPDALYAGTKGPLLFRSDDDGASWRELAAFGARRRWYWWTPVSKPHRQAEAQEIAIAPTQPRVILVGIEAGALLRSDDGGDSWSDHRPGAVRDCHNVRFHARSPSYAYQGGGGGGAFSRDGGRTWTRPRGLGRVRYGWAAAGDRDNPELRFLSAARSVRSAHGAQQRAQILRSQADGPWQPVLEVDAMPYALLPAAGRLYAGLSNGQVLETIDGGEHWSPLPFAFSSISRSLIALTPRQTT